MAAGVSGWVVTLVRSIGSDGRKAVVGVEQWAEVRRMRRVEGLSAREIGRRTGLARDTVSRLLAAEEPPRYSRAPAGSILDPFKDWICEQLQADPKAPPSQPRWSTGSSTTPTSSASRATATASAARTSSPGQHHQQTPPNPTRRRQFPPLAYGSLQKPPAYQPSSGLVFKRHNWPTFQPALTAARIADWPSGCIEPPARTESRRFA